VTDPEPEGVAPDSGSVTRAAPQRRFSLLLTVACSIIVAIYIGLPLGPLIDSKASPLDQLDRPEESLRRLVTRELDLYEAMRHGLVWEWRLYRILSGGEDPVGQARGWYDEMVDTVDSPAAELGRAILLGESGEVDRTEEAISQWKSSGESGERMASWISAAYLGLPPGADAGRDMIALIRDTLEDDWFADTLVARIATRIEDMPARTEAHAGIVSRGRILQRRLRLLMALTLALIVLGTLILVRWLARRSSPRVADAPLPPDWSFADGYALFVRGLGVPHAIILVILFLLRRETPFEPVLMMAAELPLFWWVAVDLQARQTSMGAAFGLIPPRQAWPRLAGVTLVLVGLGLIGDAAITGAGSLVGLNSHWADGFSENILWDPRWLFVVDTFDASVWAPVFEELTFRGLLYGTLRTRLGPWPSALASAALFTVPHGYAAAGSLSVLMSGLLWAWAYERTRSLLPGLLAHSANNLMSTLWTVSLFRL
jgi:CAAX protease family protein